MLVWPNRVQADDAVRRWAAETSVSRSELRQLGYFGSYARGDWGVGSDLDLVALVASADQPFGRRAVAWDLTPLPVPAEILIYTEREWQELHARGGRFARTIAEDTKWVLP